MQLYGLGKAAGRPLLTRVRVKNINPQKINTPYAFIAAKQKGSRDLTVMAKNRDGIYYPLDRAYLKGLYFLAQIKSEDKAFLEAADAISQVENDEDKVTFYSPDIIVPGCQ
jgi:hypothetical protein